MFKWPQHTKEISKLEVSWDIFIKGHCLVEGLAFTYSHQFTPDNFMEKYKVLKINLC